MKYSLAVFDMDGTILNTIDDLGGCCNVILEKHGYPTHTIEEYKYFVGNGIPKLIERALPAGTVPEIHKKILAEYIEYYSLHSADKTAPYDGIVECIKKLRAAGVKVAVNTNKVQAAAEVLCKKYFPGCFDIIAGFKDGIPPKPAPDGINAILKSEKIERENACYIGDSDVDFLCGKNSGLDFVGVDWGFRGEKFLREHGAKTVVKTADELFNVLIG